MEVYGDWIIPESYTIHVEEMEEGEIDCGTFSITTKKANHNPESIAFRVADRKSALVYSGDTDWSDDLVELAKDADVLLLECSFPDEMKVPGHLTPSEAGRLARLAGVKKLVLTHLYPPMEEVDIAVSVGGHFPGEVIRARDLMVISF
jgi:ribonuclease BN (tRNA processing enzyme)